MDWRVMWSLVLLEKGAFCIYMEFKKMVMITLYAKQKKRHRCTEQTFGLWEKARVGRSERITLKQIYYQGWNWSPAQVGCMRQVLRAGALGRRRGMGWGGRREGGSGWGTHVNPWLIHVNVWQKPLQYYKVISLQLIKINEKKRGCFLWPVCSLDKYPLAFTLLHFVLPGQTCLLFQVSLDFLLLHSNPL